MSGPSWSFVMGGSGRLLIPQLAGLSGGIAACARTRSRSPVGWQQQREERFCADRPKRRASLFSLWRKRSSETFAICRPRRLSSRLFCPATAASGTVRHRED